MTLRPADIDSGIVVRRTDLKGDDTEIPVTWRHVVDTRMATTIANESGVRVGTVEHLMAAFSGCEIDNLKIELDGPEVPIMDGSAAPFVFLIECAGVIEQDAPRRAVRILKSVEVGDEQRRITIDPQDGFSIDFEIDFDCSTMTQQEFGIRLAIGAFKADISRARTFGFEHEVAQLRQAGFALGGSLDNAIVISGEKVINEGGLRFEDEFVRHKVLDCIGDLYLAGAPIMGHVHGSRSGHTLNHRLLQALFADDDAWCYDDLSLPDRDVMRLDWLDTDVRAAAG